MDPITLRIQTELLSELESEAEEYGYSSRAEYIRQLLQHRRPTRELLATDDSVDLADSETVATNREDIRQLHQQLNAAVQRIETLEERIEPEDSGTDMITEAEVAGDSDSDSTSLSELETWLTEDSKKDETVVSIILFAAELLQETGPLQKGELKEQLYDEYPNAYKTENSLFGATVERVYQEAPGFRKPKYGMYDFE